MTTKTRPTSLEQLPALLTPSDLACVTGRSDQTIRRLMRQGVLPAVKIGRAWYCPKADFAEWLKGASYGLL